ncbi:MAG: hypothetical protein N3A63_04995 [Bacteroidetes bacterium]|nr:hypothetical protein [Bacteroidota bacterium]
MKPKTKALLALVISFTLGVASGVLLTRLIWKPVFFMKHQDFWKEVREKLELTKDQQDRIDSLLCSSKRVIDEHKKAIIQVKDSVKKEIDKILTDKQRDALEQLLKELPTPKK